MSGSLNEMLEANYAELLAAAGDVPLSDEEKRLLRWLARWDQATRDAMAGLLRRLPAAPRD